VAQQVSEQGTKGKEGQERTKELVRTMLNRGPSESNAKAPPAAPYGKEGRIDGITEALPHPSMDFDGYVPPAVTQVFRDFDPQEADGGAGYAGADMRRLFPGIKLRRFAGGGQSDSARTFSDYDPNEYADEVEDRPGPIGKPGPMVKPGPVGKPAVPSDHEEEKQPIGPGTQTPTSRAPDGQVFDPESVAAAQTAGVDPLTGELLGNTESPGEPELPKLTKEQLALHERGNRMFRNFDARRHVLPGELPPRRHDLGPGAREHRENAADVLEPTDAYIKQLKAELAEPPKSAPVDQIKPGPLQASPERPAGTGLGPISGYETAQGDEETASGHELRMALERIRRR
jgi:hypothetical protein